MSEHSPEPWATTGISYTEPNNEPVAHDGIFSASGMLIGDAIVGRGYEEDFAYMSPANVKRIVACVNALKGIPTENLNDPLYIASWLAALKGFGVTPRLKADKGYRWVSPDK